MPPPEPRSSTISPAARLARAVGLPQPSDARSAASGTAAASPSAYRFEVMGSQHSRPDAGLDPQQEEPLPAATRFAAWPYFSFTTSFTFSELIKFSFLFSTRSALLHPCWDVSLRNPVTRIRSRQSHPIG